MAKTLRSFSTGARFHKSSAAKLCGALAFTFCYQARAQEAAPAEQPVASPSAEVAPSTEVAPEAEKKATSDHALNNSKSRFRLGKGLAFESQDKQFAMIPRIRGQFLYTVQKAEEAEGEMGDATQSFQLRRVRLQFGGHFWGENNKYKMELAVSPADVGAKDTATSRAPTTSPLLDMYLDLSHFKNLSVRLGQYKVPFNRQRVISSGDLQMVDRSIVNSVFNVDRDLGFDLRSEDFLGLDLLRYYAGLYAGEGRNTSHASDFGMMYLSRVELLPLGMEGFKDYKESSLERPQALKLSIGLGYGYLDDAKWERGITGSVPEDGGTTDMHLLNADTMLKVGGFSLFSEFVYRNGSRNLGNAVDEDDNPIAESPALNGYGLMVQSGYLLPSAPFEVTARVATVAGEANGGLDDEDELGLGLSYYFAEHAYKLQGDYFLLREGPPDSRAEDRLVAHRFRVQLQASY